jgi:2,5-dioxopentanoate dehydrogenase
VFSLLYDAGHEVAQALVRHPEVKAVAFTGSRSGGMALMEVASSRPEPIPFYAEMSSINPVFVLPGALTTRREAIARELHASATLGVGQFCTNPGVVVTLGDSHAANSLVSRFVELMSTTAPGIMLNRRIAASYHQAVSERTRQRNVHVRWSGGPEARFAECSAATSVFETDAQSFLANSDLQDEIFGPATLVVKAESRDELFEVARSLYGNLTATRSWETPRISLRFPISSPFSKERLAEFSLTLSRPASRSAKRWSHGGPYPATSDGRSTSVGGRAILRFTRPVCYQDFPDAALPTELQEGNPLGIWRVEDGQYVEPSAKMGQTNGPP